ncbi:MAG: NAD-dependent malic enzyme [Blastocatellia bacterium]|jgi:malate dehydrogenase (oxaloacetate-decarboxylating)|nr:NAD-dependent malic enzyme [Blastocatellia bacterium]MBK6425991.1 NAD-dependent malic enzyme [Blastocatellia bacterium]
MFVNPLVRTLRCRIRRRPGSFGLLATAIGSAGALIGEIRTQRLGTVHTIRDIEVLVSDLDHLDRVLAVIAESTDAEVMEVIDEVRRKHVGGKIHMVSRFPVTSLADLRRVYTPGVAEICRLIAADSSKAKVYTSIPRTVAIVTDGTAILGLGNIGAVAGMPVMEGKAMLLEQLVGLSGVPILLDTTDPDEIVRTVCAIAPGFGAIQLEDIAAPACFEVESRLVAALRMPIFHDDQHGTATVTLAAILTACKRARRDVRSSVIGQIGLGAAGATIARFAMQVSDRPVLGADLSDDAVRRHVAAGGVGSTLDEVMRHADIVVATTGVRGLIKPEQVRPGQIILALSNPDPEIEPEVALASGAAFALDGASVNNLLAFPGILRGALDAGATGVTREMFVAAANAIADFGAWHDVTVPDPLDRMVHRNVAHAVARAAHDCGVATTTLDADYYGAADLD